MVNELVKWNKARQAIVEAKSIDEVKLIRDKAEVMRAYAKQIGESLDVQNDICEIKLRAERRMGEMLKETKLQEGARTPKTELHDVTSLKDLGIEKHQSSRWQKIADLPEKTFENTIQEIKQAKEELTEAFMLKQKKIIDRELDIQKQKEDIESGKIKLPEGKFEVIVVDPPWQYHDDSVYDPKGFRGTTTYPTMTLEEIKVIDLPYSDNCVLWLWTTHKFMRHCFGLLDKWGFEEKAILTWVKQKMGIGRWLRSKSEFCIMAIKGKPTINLTNQTTVLEGKTREHSRKPDEFYNMVEKLCIGRRLDYFGREQRKGWTIFGIESTKFDNDKIPTKKVDEDGRIK